MPRFREVATMMPARLLSPAMLGLLLPAAPAGWPNSPNWREGDLLLVWGDLGLCAHFLWLAFSPELAVLSSRVPKTHGSPLLRLNIILICTAVPCGFQCTHDREYDIRSQAEGVLCPCLSRQALPELFPGLERAPRGTSTSVVPNPCNASGWVTDGRQRHGC